MKDSYLFYKDKLQGKYKDVFEQVEMYVNSENIDALTCEDRLGSLLDMLLIAQEAGKPVEKVVGNSIEKFCKTFCSDLGTQNKIWHALDILKNVAIIELICAVLDLLCADWSGNNFWSMISTTNASGYIFCFIVCALIGYVTNLVVRFFMFKSKKLNMNLLKSIILCITGASFVAVYGILSSDKLNFFTCPLWAVILASSAYLVIYFILNHKRSVDKKHPKINFSDLVTEQSRVNCGLIMEKRYNTLNKRNIKKGRGELPIRDFLDNEEKECDKSDRLGWLFYLAPIVIVGISLFFTKFDSVFDILIYLAITLIIEYVIMHFFFKISKDAATQKREWISAKRNELDNQK